MATPLIDFISTFPEYKFDLPNYIRTSLFAQQMLEQLNRSGNALHGHQECWVGEDELQSFINTPPSSLRTFPPNFDKGQSFQSIAPLDRNSIKLWSSNFVTPLDQRIFYKRTSGTSGASIMVYLSEAFQHWETVALARRLSRFANLELDNRPVKLLAFKNGPKDDCYVLLEPFDDGGLLVRNHIDERYIDSIGRALRAIKTLQPFFLVSKPALFQALLWGLKVGIEPIPKGLHAIISTGYTLSPSIKHELESTFCCPVVDVYVTSELGASAFCCSENVFHFDHSLIYPEVLQGQQRVVVSSLCNDAMPLLRYSMSNEFHVDRSPPYCAVHKLPGYTLKRSKPGTFVELNQHNGFEFGRIPVAEILNAPVLKIEAYAGQTVMDVLITVTDGHGQRARTCCDRLCAEIRQQLPVPLQVKIQITEERGSPHWYAS